MELRGVEPPASSLRISIRPKTVLFLILSVTICYQQTPFVTEKGGDLM